MQVSYRNGPAFEKQINKLSKNKSFITLKQKSENNIQKLTFALRQSKFS